MVAAIKEYGIPIPILGRHRGETIEIVDGHLRVDASRRIGLPTIPVVLSDGWSEAQVKGFRLHVNRSATWATWVEELVTLELADLDAGGFDLSLTGDDPFEINEFLFPDAVESSAETVPELPKSAVTRMGDLWLCDSHRILSACGIEPADIDQKRRSRNTPGRICFPAKVEANAKVGKTLFEMASGGGEVAATIFWSKTRGGFREHQKAAAPPPAVLPNFVVSLEKKAA